MFADDSGAPGAQIGSDIVGVNNYGNFRGSLDGLSTSTDYWIKTIITETTTDSPAKVTEMVVGPAKFTTPASESFASSLNFTTGNGFAGGTSPMSSATWAPEPTSGILMLVGLGALALRRRKA